MGLEDNIKQKSFASEAQKAIVNVAFTQSYLSGLMHNAFKKHKISSQQFNVLRIIQGQYPKPVCITDITSRMIDKMSNASRLVDKLALKNLVARTACSTDKRQVDISITEEGQIQLQELNLLVNNIIEKHNHLSAEEFETLNNLLDKMRLE